MRIALAVLLGGLLVLFVCGWICGGRVTWADILEVAVYLLEVLIS